MEDEQQPDQMAHEAMPMQSEAPHLTRRQRRQRRHHKKILLLVIGGAVLLVLLAAFAAYWFLVRDDKASQAKPAATQSAKKQTVAAPVVDPTPVSFKSTKLNIEITHRKDWVLKESTDGEITITSPQTSYTKADGRATTGVFTVKLRKGVPDAMKATIEKSIATRDSEVIAYAAPTEQQRQYTNLSYVGIQKDAFNFFIVTGSTELKTGNALAYTLPLDGEFYLVTGGFGNPGTNLGFETVNKTSVDSSATAEAIKIVESLKIY